MPAVSQCLNAPPLSLAERQNQMIARRLSLLLEQMNARTERNWPEVERVGQEIAAVTRRLRMIEQAGG